MYLSQHTQPAQDVKVRRVRGALRVLAALGVAVAAVAFALFLLVAQLGPAPGASVAYQYAKLHATLYGKIAALSHHDVLKTTELLTCSDGVQNFTCLPSKNRHYAGSERAKEGRRGAGGLAGCASLGSRA